MAEWLRYARVGVLTLLAAAGAAVTAGAQTAPLASSFDELPATLKVGTMVSVQDDQGKRVKGKLTALSPDSMVVYSRGVIPIGYRFDRQQVTRIVALDSTNDGFWIGFAAGAAPGLLLAAGVNAYCYNESPSHCPGAFPILGGLFGLAGGLIGKAVDGAINKGPVLYSRPAARGPRATVTPFATAGAHGGGVMVSVGF